MNRKYWDNFFKSDKLYSVNARGAFSWHKKIVLEYDQIMKSKDKDIELFKKSLECKPYDL